VPLKELANRLTKHNEAQHGGEKHAQVDPDVADQLANLIAKDMGLLEEEEA
jgi:hypothetical protein